MFWETWFNTRTFLVPSRLAVSIMRSTLHKYTHSTSATVNLLHLSLYIHALVPMHCEVLCIHVLQAHFLHFLLYNTNVYEVLSRNSALLLKETWFSLALLPLHLDINIAKHYKLWHVMGPLSAPSLCLQDLCALRLGSLDFFDFALSALCSGNIMVLAVSGRSATVL